MKKIYILILLLIVCAPCPLIAQQAEEPPSKFYLDAHAGSPLFWGDISSLGAKNYPGIAIGAAAGYRIKKWMALELGLDHGAGVLGAASDQANDLLDNAGVIRYTNGNWKLGNVYSRTVFTRVGLRVPVQVFTMFAPAKNRRVDAELAPHIYLNHFKPGIYDIASNKKLTTGAKPGGWAYAPGGDIGINAKIGDRVKIYLRSAVSWLSDERFEGISSEPPWRVNLQSYTTIGFQFDVGKRE